MLQISIFFSYTLFFLFALPLVTAGQSLLLASIWILYVMSILKNEFTSKKDFIKSNALMKSTYQHVISMY